MQKTQQSDLAEYHSLVSQHRLQDAESFLLERLKHDIDRVDVLFELGNINQKRSAHIGAIDYYQRVLNTEPNHIQARLFMAGSLQELDQHKDAAREIETALKQDPENPGIHHALGVNYQMAGDLDAARRSYEDAIELDSKLGDSHNNLGLILSAQGHTDAAIRHLDIAIKLDPRDYKAIYNRASMTKHKKVDQKLIRIEKRFGSKSISDDERMHLGFALGKAYDDIGNYKKAAEFYTAANDSQRRLQPYRIESALNHFRAVEEAFRSDPLKDISMPARDTVTPIFILGMPRSGSSLLEHILASHSQVIGGGEMEALRHGISATLPFYERDVSHVTESDLTEIADAYLEHIASIADGRARYVVDKMPSNFEFLGIVHAAMPHSRIIRTDRNPLDTCLSCYQQKFESARQSFSNDLNDLAQYHLACQRLLDFWESKYPDWIITVPYEDIASAPEPAIRTLLDSLNLNFEESCLQHHLNKEHSVYTASHLQVRNSIHGRSVDRWRRYEKMLAPLISHLGRP